MAHEGVILLKKKEQVIPKDLFNKVLAEHQSCMGYALAADGKIYMATYDDPPFRWEEIEEIMTHQKQYEIMFFFGKFPAGFMKEDLQPFTLFSNEGDVPLIVGFMVGDYTPFTRPDSNLSNAYHCLTTVIQEDIDQLIRLTKGDIGAIMEEINTPKSRKNWLGNNVSSGAIAILGSTGQWVLFQNNNSFREFPWGWATNNLGFEVGAMQPAAVAKAPEAKSRSLGLPGVKPKAAPQVASVEPLKPVVASPTAVPKIVPKPTGGFAAIDAKAKESPTDPHANEAGKPPIIDRSSLQPAAATAVPAKATAAEQKYYPPVRNMGRDELRAEFMTVMGSVPHEPSYKKKPPVLLSQLKITPEQVLARGWTTERGKSKAPVILQDLRDLGKATAPAQPPAEPATPVVTAPPAAVPAAAEVKKPTLGVKPKVVSQEPPAAVAASPRNDYSNVIPAPEIQAFTAFLKTIENDPKYLPSDEDDKIPSFSEMAGLKGLEDTFRWSRDTIKKVSNYKGYSSALIFDLRGLVIKLLKATPMVAAPPAPLAADKPKTRVLGIGRK